MWSEFEKVKSHGGITLSNCQCTDLLVAELVPATVFRARDAERPMPHARRQVTGRSKGNRNAWKHGLYSAESVRLRRYPQAMARLAIETSVG
jgi:hypothetical protein